MTLYSLNFYFLGIDSERKLRSIYDQNVTLAGDVIIFSSSGLIFLITVVPIILNIRSLIKRCRDRNKVIDENQGNSNRSQRHQVTTQQSNLLTTGDILYTQKFIPHKPKNQQGTNNQLELNMNQKSSIPNPQRTEIEQKKNLQYSQSQINESTFIQEEFLNCLRNFKIKEGERKKIGDKEETKREKQKDRRKDKKR